MESPVYQFRVNPPNGLKLIAGDRQTHRLAGDLTSLLPFFNESTLTEMNIGDHLNIDVNKK
jgi:hypothetical protein